MARSTGKVQITREGWFYLLVLAFVLCGALLRDINLLILLFGLLAGPLIYSWWHTAAALGKLQVRRHLPLHLRAGAPFTVEVEITNPRRWLASWVVELEDSLRPEQAQRKSQVHRTRLSLLRLAPGETRRLRYEVQLRDRGRYQLGPLVLSTRFPLGLVRRRIEIAAPQSLVAWPRVGQLGPRARRWFDPQRQDTARSSRRRGFLDGEFYGLRDWRTGDSRRMIHWRTTARTGQVMVRQFERQKAEELALLLHLWQPARPSADDRRRVERAVSLAAALVEEAGRHAGGQILLAVAGADFFAARGVASTGWVHHFLDTLALVEPGPDDRLGEMLGRVYQINRGAGNTLLISTRAADLDRQRQLGGLAAGPGLTAWIDRIDGVSTTDELAASLMLANS